MPPETSEQSSWFNENLLPHEPMLRAWLKSRFPSELDIDDLIQESYLKVLKAHETVPMGNPKAFLFATARNLALDYVKQPSFSRTDYLEQYEFVDFADESLGVAEIAARNQELEIMTKAVQSLPKRCRQAFTLAKIYGMSHKDIARKLGISRHTVAVQLRIGLFKCAEFVDEFRKQGRP